MPTTEPAPTPVPTPVPTSAPAPADTPEPIQVSESTPEPVAVPTVDVDLTKLSSTMVYSEVYNMMNSPKEYVGKTVRMYGPAASTTIGDITYYAVII